MNLDRLLDFLQIARVERRPLRPAVPDQRLRHELDPLAAKRPKATQRALQRDRAAHQRVVARERPLGFTRVRQRVEAQLAPLALGPRQRLLPVEQGHARVGRIGHSAQAPVDRGGRRVAAQ